jgi:ApaG protein
METSITNDIKVSVESFYQPSYSKPVKNEYVFAYRITIENLSNHTVQLLRRYWHIWDSNAVEREVEGEGVVGDQPILKAGQSYQYVSGCPLVTDMGTMKGYFKMQKPDTEEFFDVEIPKFQLIAPFKNN